MVVPDGFNFDMVASLPISIQLPTIISYSSTNRIIEIWSENTEGRPGKIIKTGAADHTGVYQENIRIPATTKRIFTNCYAGWRIVNINESLLKLNDGVLTVDYNIGYGKSPPKPKQGMILSTGNYMQSFRPGLKSGIENLAGNGDFSVNKLEKIDTWSSGFDIDGIWRTTDDANLYGAIINQEGNSFARINSQAYTTGGFTQLVKASAGQIVTFSGDTRGFDSQQDIYLYLVPRDANGEYLDLFSFNLINPGINWTNGTVAGHMPEGTVSCQVLFFKGSTGSVDFDNAVVRVNDLDSDRDRDGVLDWEDNYPDNPNQAFDDYYPAKDKPGSYAFEDLWPASGDFDYNDLVVDYEINRISNAANRVVEIVVSTQIRAIGSNIRKGFGIQLNLDRDLVSGIKSDLPVPADGIQLNENGTESNQKLATFILFDDAMNLLTHPADGSPTINTTMGFHFIVPEEHRFRIFFKEPVDQEKTNPVNINPFIFRSGERSREVHLKGFPPTDLATRELFGTESDMTDPAAGICYQTKNGLPWAINLPVLFEYPVENADLLKGYPVLAQWILSRGNQSSDWYQDKQGYRVWDNIYRW